MYSTAAVHKKYFEPTVKWNLKAQYMHNIGSNNRPSRLHPGWLLLLCTSADQLQLLTTTAITIAHMVRERTSHFPVAVTGYCHALQELLGEIILEQTCHASGAFVICFNKSLALALLISSVPKVPRGRLLSSSEYWPTPFATSSKSKDVTATLKYWTMQVQALYYASKYGTHKLDKGNE